MKLNFFHVEVGLVFRRAHMQCPTPSGLHLGVGGGGSGEGLASPRKAPAPPPSRIFCMQP